MDDKNRDEDGLTRTQYVALAAFRYELRRFLAFSETAAHGAGLPAQQHQALLAIAGFDGADAPTVGTLSERLMIAPHTATELTARMVEAGLISKLPSRQDRRKVHLALTDKAEDLLAELSTAHLKELKSLEPALTAALARLGRDRA
ncbi:MarR family transcriptional regulator [Caulobacter sp. Root1455]|uniref:MarR family winged helix-turn-helix transcriptional regulator n=1 Tax=unclassified Caulobacter TaxID=2648921 RepID=UPI0006FFD1DF|nr:MULTISPECIES: MarR family transcriptional regulator [unclassified Caulobacter]KQY31167.1 MarR family transcriptional regulator [Caulobacter sp. Root487D2Y]KQY95464.1 MarR family transcriptional regulator [Caulobacter sp. Root1455]